MEIIKIGYCSICLNNSHEEVKMVKREIISTDEKGYWRMDGLICPKCGSCVICNW
jgi:hypothetical protein